MNEGESEFDNGFGAEELVEFDVTGCDQQDSEAYRHSKLTISKDRVPFVEFEQNTAQTVSTDISGWEGTACAETGNDSDISLVAESSVRWPVEIERHRTPLEARRDRLEKEFLRSLLAPQFRQESYANIRASKTKSVNEPYDTARMELETATCCLRLADVLEKGNLKAGIEILNELMQRRRNGDMLALQVLESYKTGSQDFSLLAAAIREDEQLKGLINRLIVRHPEWAVKLNLTEPQIERFPFQNQDCTSQQRTC